MSPAEFRQLAAAASLHTRYIYLHVKGEPLLHPALGELLAIAHEYGLMVNLTTNGVLLPQQKNLLLDSQSLRQTNLSIHGYHEQSHGPLGAWLAVLCDYARQSSAKGRYTVFRFWSLDKARKATGDGARALALLQQEFPRGESLASLSGQRAVQLDERVFVSFEEQFTWPDVKNPDYGTVGSCYGGRAMIGILADGTIVPCCLDGEGVCALGNALETPLATILDTKRYRALAGGFANHQVVEPLCRRCGYRLRFDKTPHTQNELETL